MSLGQMMMRPILRLKPPKARSRFHEWIGDGGAILFSHPKDFTPVCMTELGYMAGLEPEFAKRHCKIIGLSVDPVSNQQQMVSGHRRDPGPQGELPDDR